MREIKFRAWTGKRIIQGQTFWNCLNNWQGMENAEWILMQYTGLKDKNGKEIYEGDIVKIDGKKIVEIFYEHLAFWMRGDFEGRYLPSFLRQKDYEIIGNIYENPDLLPKH